MSELTYRKIHNAVVNHQAFLAAAIQLWRSRRLEKTQRWSCVIDGGLNQPDALGTQRLVFPP